MYLLNIIANFLSPAPFLQKIQVRLRRIPEQLQLSLVKHPAPIKNQETISGSNMFSLDSIVSLVHPNFPQSDRFVPFSLKICPSILVL